MYLILASGHPPMSNVSQLAEIQRILQAYFHPNNVVVVGMSKLHRFFGLLSEDDSGEKCRDVEVSFEQVHTSPQTPQLQPVDICLLLITFPARLCDLVPRGVARMCPGHGRHSHPPPESGAALWNQCCARQKEA